MAMNPTVSAAQCGRRSAPIVSRLGIGRRCPSTFLVADAMASQAWMAEPLDGVAKKEAHDGSGKAKFTELHQVSLQAETSYVRKKRTIVYSRAATRLPWFDDKHSLFVRNYPKLYVD